MKKPIRVLRAFSLVEVVFAMAIVSFCLVVLLGLLSTGLVNSKKSNDDTNIAGIVWQVSNTLRSQKASSNLNLTTNYYFDVSGQLTNAPSGGYPASSPSHFYTCTLTPAPTTFSTLINATTPATTLSSATFSNVMIQISYSGHDPKYTGQVPYTSYVTIPPP